jgi:tetratricopeptide (TPR) repeat protein
MNLAALSFAVLLIARAAPTVPDDLENAFQNLQQAESKKDPAQVKKLATETCALARQAASSPAPEGEDEKEAWTKRVAYARDVELHTEYALYATAVQGQPATTVDLLSTLEQQNPKSKYLEEAYGAYILALNQTGAASKIPAVAEKAIAHFPNGEDLLLVLADTALNRQQSERARGYAERLVAVLSKHPKPEGMAAADWERKRSTALGRGYWIAGFVHSEKTQYYEADKDLRAALPFIKGNEAMMAAALFYLGVANYQLGSATRNKARVLEAAKFSDQAAAIKGPYSDQAWRNAQIMRTEAGKMR